MFLSFLSATLNMRRQQRPNKLLPRCSRLGILIVSILLLYFVVVLSFLRIPATSLPPVSTEKKLDGVRGYLESMRSDAHERRMEIFEQPDYLNPVYDLENARLKEEAAVNPVLLGSLKLITRAGHRRRVTDLIGSKPMNPTESRQAIATQTNTFVQSQQQQQPRMRDYSTQPIRIPLPEERCSALPCKPCSNNDDPTTTTQCDSTIQQWTMENIKREQNKSPYSIVGTPSLESNVPLPYFSWHDFGLLKPNPLPHTKDKKLAVAFISNCNFAKRNEMVKQLQLVFNSSMIGAYGRCFDKENKRGGIATKLDTLSTEYKFSLAFENSETKDYVTEKFYEPLVAGAVPIYMGAPNVKFFAPDTTDYPYESIAVLRTRDFGDDAVRIARVLSELDANKQMFEEMKSWKHTVGYSDDFKTTAEITSVHSTCRACIFAADELRRRKGANQYDMRKLTFVGSSESSNFALYVRERGTYHFTRFAFDSKPHSIVHLLELVLANINKQQVNLWKDNARAETPTRVYALYTLSSSQRRPVLSNEDVLALPNLAELEIIFV